MTDLLEIQADAVTPEQLNSLAAFAEDMAEGELRDLIDALVTSLADGTTVAMIGSDDDYTPTQVAKRLKMSRTHLYKLLDIGAIPSHRVGRDRRISGKDVIRFEKQRQQERRALAARLDQGDALHAQALTELAESFADQM